MDWNNAKQEEIYSTVRKVIESAGLTCVRVNPSSIDCDSVRLLYGERRCMLGYLDIPEIAKSNSPVVQMDVDEYGKVVIRVATIVARYIYGYGFNLYDRSHVYIAPVEDESEIRAAVDRVTRKLYGRIKADRTEEIDNILKDL